METTHVILLLLAVDLGATLGLGLVGCAVIAAFLAGVLLGRATRRFGPTGWRPSRNDHVASVGAHLGEA
jgi:hypothetical protein